MAKLHVAVLLVMTVLGPTACMHTREPEPVARLPFTFAHQMVLLAGSVNDAPCWFLLDSGAAQTILDARLAEAADAQVGDATFVSGYGPATVPTRVITGATAQLGVVRLPLLHARCAPAEQFDSLSAVVGHRIDGVLGYELFCRYALKIDYRNRSISLYEPEVALAAGGGEEIPLNIEHGCAVVRAEVRPTARAPRIACNLVLDTGSNNQVVLRQDFIGRHAEAFAGWSTAGRAMVHGVGGASESRSGEFAELCLGERLVFQRVAAQVVEGSSPFASDGAAGSGLFQECAVIFDYPRRRLIVIPPGWR